MERLKKFFSNKIVLICLAVVVIIVGVLVKIFVFNGEDKVNNRVEYSVLMEELDAGNVFAVVYNPDSENLRYYILTDETLDNTIDIDKLSLTDEEIDRAGDKNLAEYITQNPRLEDFKYQLMQSDVIVRESLDEKNIDYNRIFNMVYSMLLIVSMLAIIKLVFMSLKGKSIATEVDSSEVDITFDDIAGYDETKKNMQFIVKALKDREKFEEIGANVPKGIILYGPPGTGKTLFAKAVAGSANVGFLSVSGSDFEEMFAGLGAKRVRDLYKKAREIAPCVVFIDEIDAIGGKRSSVTDGGSNERQQILNAMLSELDGFNELDGVITICATNRIDILDDALVRPGRFDRKIAVPLPDKKERKEVINMYLSKKKCSDNLGIKRLAAITEGFSNAKIEALVNEAAITAVMNEHSEITNSDIEEALSKILTDGELKKIDNKKEQYIVSWHEAGHALATRLLTDKKVSKVTIIGSTSGVGGYTLSTNDDDKNFISRVELENEIKVLYAGRIAEELYFGDRDNITTGASNDIKVATDYIRSYLTNFGMSNTVSLIDVERFFSSDKNMDVNSSYMKEVFDEAVELSSKWYEEVRELLEDNYQILKKFALELYNNETLYEEDINVILKEN